jgi:hypothetical protein
MQDNAFVTTRRRWFARGVMVGILFCAALNAISYFVRSDDGGNLLGTQPDRVEAIGFPVEIWESGNAYNGFYVDYPALSINATFAAAVGCVCGLILIRMRDQLNQLVADFEWQEQSKRTNFQFSMRALLILTSLVALIAALGRYALAGRPEVLGVIYLLGPWILVMIAFLPKRIPWQQRVMILVPTAILMILAAVMIGSSLARFRDFDQVLMGIFVCWTPQSVIVATALTIAILVTHRRNLQGSSTFRQSSK